MPTRVWQGKTRSSICADDVLSLAREVSEWRLTVVATCIHSVHS